MEMDYVHCNPAQGTASTSDHKICKRMILDLMKFFVAYTGKRNVGFQNIWFVITNDPGVIRRTIKKGKNSGRS